MTAAPLDLADYLLIAEAVTGTGAEALAPAVKTEVAESALAAPFAGFGDHEQYPEFADKAAILCSRLVRNHPLPDGNKRAAYVAMIEFIERHGRTWDSSGGIDEVAGTIERLAARQLDEAEFRTWVRGRVSG